VKVARTFRRSGMQTRWVTTSQVTTSRTPSSVASSAVSAVWIGTPFAER